MSPTPQTVTDMQNRRDAEQEATEREAELEERVRELERETAALRWALGVTPGMAELSVNFEKRSRDPSYRG